jgi:hypothetical protein
MEETHENEQADAPNGHQQEDKLRNFLLKRKLQISVLKRMLEQIPLQELPNDQGPKPEEEKQ